MELPPPPDIVRAAYAELVVTDLGEARRFWVDLLGFVVSSSSDHALYLRGYDELIHHNLILREGRQPAAARLALSHNTIGTHMRSIFSKLNVQSRVQLSNVLRARENDAES